MEFQVTLYLQVGMIDSQLPLHQQQRQRISLKGL